MRKNHLLLLVLFSTVLSLTYEKNYAIKDCSRPLTTNEKLTATLLTLYKDGTTLIDGGATGIYNNLYSDSVNFLEDASMLGNFPETMAILRDGYNLAIERRKVIDVTDTTYYNIIGLKQKEYRLEFVATGLNHPGLTGFVIDSFLNTRTPLNLNDTTDIQFTVTGNLLSASARRFTVVFIASAAAPVPVTFTGIKAIQQNDNNIAIEWNVEKQVNIKEYQVQKSANGIDFSIATTITAIGNNPPAFTYKWIDSKAVAGDSYYRIRSIGKDGDIVYSNIVEAKVREGIASIAIYPNPVQDGLIGLKFTNAVKGAYQLKFVNDIGQVVFNTSINHHGGSATQSIQTCNVLLKGIYTLAVIAPDKTKTILKIIIQ